jgi:spore germination protein KB
VKKMLDNGKISVRQFTVVVILFTIGSGILVLPSLLAAELNQDAWIAIIFGGTILFTIVILCILVLGPDHTARQLYPSYLLAQKINVGEFVQRIEVIIAIMWFLSVFIKMTIYFYGSVIGFAQMLKLESYRFLILPFGMIMIPATLVMHPDVIYLQTFDTEIWPVYGSTFGLLLPLLLLAVTFVRKRHKSE